MAYYARGRSCLFAQMTTIQTLEQESVVLCRIWYSQVQVATRRNASRMRSLKFKIFAAIMLCSAVSVVLVGLVGIYSSNRMLTKSSDEAARLLAENNGKTLNLVIDKIESSVNGLAISVTSMLDNVAQFKSDPAYVNSFQEKIRPIAEQFARNTEGAMSFYVRFNPAFTEPTSGLFHADTDGDGNIERLTPTDFSQYDPSDDAHVGWYYIPVRAGTAVWLDPYLNENIGVQMISYVVPIEVDGESIGVVGMDIDFSRFTEIVNGIKPYPNSYGALLNADLDYLIHPESSQTGNSSKLTDIDPGLSEAVRDHALGVTTSGEQLIAYARLSNGHTLLIHSLKRDIYQEMNELTQRILAVLAGIVLIALSVAWFVGGRMSRPLRSLIAVLGRVKEGDFTVRASIRQRDEIGEIGQHFNGMVQELESLTKSIRSVSRKIDGSSQSLGAVAEEVTASSEEAAASAQEIAAGNKTQAELIDHCSTISSALSEKFERLSGNTAEVLRAMTEMKADNRDGLALMNSLNEANEINGQAIRRIEQTVQELDGNIRSIVTILEQLKQIADQSELLALNASIESSRAGEAGRGFAIVAGEIRKLAEQSKRWTESIGEIVSDVQANAAHTVDAMHHVKERSAEQTEAVANVSRAFDRLSAAVGEVTERMETNGAYIMQAQEDGDKLAGEIIEIASISEQSASSSQQVSAAVSEQAQGFGKVAEEVEALNRLTAELNALVQRFK